MSLEELVFSNGKKKPFNEESNAFFDFSSKRFEPIPTQPRPQPQPQPQFQKPQPTPQPQYARQQMYPQPQPRYYPQPVYYVKPTPERKTNFIKVIKKISSQHRKAKIKEAKKLKRDIRERIAYRKAKEKIQALRAERKALVSQSRKENIQAVKSSVGGFFGFLRAKVPRGGTYGVRQKVSLPKADVK